MHASPVPIAVPVDVRVETVAGTALGAGGALYLLLHLAALPGFAVTLLIGFGGGRGFWPLCGALTAAVLGVAAVVHARRRAAAHRAFVERVARMRTARPPAPPAPAPPAPGSFRFADPYARLPTDRGRR